MARTEYDELGNILTLTRGRGTVSGGDYANAAFVADRTTSRSLLYDSLGRRTHNLDPDSGTSRYYYNRFGELTRFVDARGAVSRFLYDMAGRLIVEDHGFDVAGGAAWAPPGDDGHSADDDASLPDQAELMGSLWSGYQHGAEEA
jgi:YD repeat-containing protein